MTGPPTFRIEELNPFQEWHHHGSTHIQQNALAWAENLSQQIHRSVRVLNEQGHILAYFEAPIKQ